MLKVKKYQRLNSLGGGEGVMKIFIKIGSDYLEVPYLREKNYLEVPYLREKNYLEVPQHKCFSDFLRVPSQNSY